MTVAAYLVGSAVGGACSGSLAGIVGRASGLAAVGDDRRGLLLVACASVVGLVAEHRRLGLRLPSLHRQVDERWLMRYRGWVYGLGYGFQLGTGVLTIVTTAAVWLTLLCAAASGSVADACALGAVFGTARGMSIISTVHIHDPAALRAMHRRIARRAEPVRRAAVAAVAAGATLATAVAAVG